MERQIFIKYVIALCVGLFLIVVVLMNVFGDKKGDAPFGEGVYTVDENDDDFDSELEELLEELEDVDTRDEESKEGEEKPVEPIESDEPEETDEKNHSINLNDTYTLATDDYGFHDEYEAIYLEKYGEEKMKEFYLNASKVAALYFSKSNDENIWKPFVTDNYLMQLDNLLPPEKKNVEEIVVHLTDPSIIEDRVIIGAVGIDNDKQEMLEIVFEPVGNDYFVSAIGVIWSDL